MADSFVEVTEGAGKPIDTRTESTNGHHRQVVVLGDPTTNSGLAAVDATNGVAVDVKASALPSGASTGAKQDTGNTSLASIDTKLPAQGQALAAASVPVVLTAAQVTTLTPPAAIAGFATSAKQDTLLTELQLKADLTETQPVSLASVPSHAVTNAGTFVVQENGAALTSLQLIDDVIYTDDTSTHATGTSKGVGIMAAATPTDGSVNANDIGMVAMTTDRKLHVAVMDALPAGSAAIGKLAANSGVDIGDVDITSIAAGDNNIGNVDIVSGVITTVSTVTAVTTLTNGGIAHDSADSGNPHKVGFKAYSPDGTTPGTAVAELDRTDAKADLDGRLFTNTRHPRWWNYHEDSSNALTDAAVAADPGDGFEIVITEIFFSTGAATACNIFFEEGATKVLGPWYLEATAGRGLMWRGEKHITASTALTVTTSAAIAHGLDIQGYIQAV